MAYTPTFNEAVYSRYADMYLEELEIESMCRDLGIERPNLFYDPVKLHEMHEAFRIISVKDERDEIQK